MSDLTLVTGATGFVGAAVVRALLARGQKVRVLSRANSSRRNLEGLDIEVAVGDLLDADSLTRAVAGCRGVYHVAADYRLWVPDPDQMFKANIDGTRSLLLAAKQAGVERIVYTSSVATLGINKDHTPSDEVTPVSIDDMIGTYKKSKFLAEEEVKRLVKDSQVPAVIVNPSMPVGPGDVKPTPTGRMVVEAASGKMPAYVDTGLNVVHVDDVAMGHLLAFDKGQVGERYILGGENLTLAEILGLICGLVGRKPPTVKLPRLPLFPIAVIAETWGRISGIEPMLTVDSLKMAAKYMHYSSARAERELGYKARPAKDAFADAIAWFKTQGVLS
jgi:dihydroflavonol-4-reductase